eukprot:scaffold222028_cov15-Tisochrysis_lutea.AAC.1
MTVHLHECWVQLPLQKQPQGGDRCALGVRLASQHRISPASLHDILSGGSELEKKLDGHAGEGRSEVAAITYLFDGEGMTVVTGDEEIGGMLHRFHV